MFFGQPSASILRFSSSVKSVEKKAKTYTAPMQWLSDRPNSEKKNQTRIVDIVLPNDALLHRKLSVPSKSLRQIEKVVALDTRQNTPFKPDQIFSVIRITEKSATGAKVEQWIAKKEALAASRAKLKSEGFIVRQVLPDDPAASPFVDFSKEIAPKSGLWRTVNVVLLVIAVGAGASIWARSNLEVVNALNRQALIVEEMRKEAVGLREELNSLDGGSDERTAFVDLVKRRSTLAATLRDMTLAMPDEVTINDMLFQSERVILRGSIQGSAAQFILDLTKNKKMKNPRLIGPISQSNDGRERFDLSLDLAHHS